MPTNALPSRPSKHVIETVLTTAWDASQVRGYDPAASLGADAYLPLATSIDSVGAVYPSVIVTPTQPGSTGGQTTYDYITAKGPGQNRQVSLLATARAEERDADDYTGDSGTYTGADAETIVEELITHVEDICFETANGGQSEFSFLGAQRPADVPDDDDPEEGRIVRLAQCEIRCGHLRNPQ